MESTSHLDNNNKPVQFLDGEFIFQSLLENQCCKTEDKDNIINPLVSVKTDVFEGQCDNLKVEQDVTCKLECDIAASDFDSKHIKTLNEYNFNEEKEKNLILKKQDIDSIAECNGNMGSLDSNEEFEVDNHVSDIESGNFQEIQFNSSEYNKETVLKNSRKKYVKPLKFVCNYCGKKFRQSNLLRQHVRIHTGQKPHKCSFCKKYFRTKTLLQLHSQDHTGLRYSCNVCKKGFKTLSSLEVHGVVHGEEKRYYCNTCCISFSQRSGLIRHIFRKHIEPNSPRVGDDKNIYISNRAQTTSLEKTYKCADCGKYFGNRNTLLVHTKIHLNIKKFSCNYCDLKFFTSSAMINHNRIHENKYEFVCSECNLGFNQRHTLKLHITSKHLKIKTFVCKFCRASFTSNTNLYAHIEVHHNKDKNKKFICNICNMGFYRRAYLYRHSKIHFDSNKQFMCDVCGYTCRTKVDIGRHVVTHFGGGDKPLKCEECGKAFSKPSHLLRHQLVHSDVRPYKCQDCDKAYKDTASLKTHRKAHHAGVTFTCRICGFHSINNQSFRRHLRSCQ